MDSSSNPSTTSTEDLDLFLDAPDEFYFDCMPRSDSHRHSSSSTRRRRSAIRRKSISSDAETKPSSSYSNGFEAVGKSSYVEESETSDGVIELAKDDLIDLSSEIENDLGVIEDQMKDMDHATDSPFQNGDIMIGERTEESTVTTVSDDGEDDHAKSQLRETNSTDWSFLGLLMKAIGFQVNLMISLVTFPPWFLHCCSLFVLDPFHTIRFGKRYLIARVAWISDMVFGTMSPFKFDYLKDPKQMLNLVCKLGWGLFWAVYVGVVLFGLLVMALMLGGFMINGLADKPFLVKEVLNFDYTKNSPEAYVPITSCAGVSCDGSCKESNEMSKIRGSRVIPQDHKLEITLSMTLPESVYNKNLGMFQVRVDFLSADGQKIASIRRPCMLRFRSEPIRLVQTFFKVVPLVTGYVSEMQTLSLKLNGFVEKEIPTACLKIMIEQRAEFRPGAGIPELYDASLSLQSDLPFFKRVIWRWRKTLYVWISMSVFITELLFTLVCCRSLIIPRTQSRSRDSSLSNSSGGR